MCMLVGVCVCMCAVGRCMYVYVCMLVGICVYVCMLVGVCVCMCAC